LESKHLKRGCPRGQPQFFILLLAFFLSVFDSLHRLIDTRLAGSNAHASVHGLDDIFVDGRVFLQSRLEELAADKIADYQANDNAAYQGEDKTDSIHGYIHNGSPLLDKRKDRNPGPFCF